MIPITWKVQSRQTYRDRKQTTGCLKIGVMRDWAVKAKRHSTCLQSNENVLESTVVMDIQLKEYTKTIEPYSLNE